MRKISLDNFDTKDFHPLGIEVDFLTNTLYVVNHAQSGSRIEIFSLSDDRLTAKHIKAIQHHLLHAPNSIHSLGDGKIFITNDHYFRAAKFPLLSKIETWSGIPSGTIVYIDTNQPDTAKIVGRVPFANGMAMINSTTIAIASTGKMGVYFFDISPSYDLVSKGYIRAPTAVDNLSVDDKGTLLLAGHPFGLSTIQLARRRPNCYPDSDKEEHRKACECNAGSWVGEWAEDVGLKVLYRGYEICSSTTAVRDGRRGVGMITGLYDRGLLVFMD
jgi:arylesterase / paraoxonase